MLKRIATFLLGIALVSLGVFFFIAPERAFALQILVRYWPIFLILAGIVRVGGHLLDRQPRSPMGGMLLTALGGVLLSSNLRGETRILEIIATHWFWFLLAIVAGRVIRQYTYRPELGPRPKAFSIPAIVVMVMVSAIGLGSHWLRGHSESLAHLRLPFRLSDIRTIFDGEFSLSEEPKTFSLGANGKLVIEGVEGDLDIHTVTGASPTARIVKRIRAATEEEARDLAQRIAFDIKSNGDDRTFSISDNGLTNPYTVILTIELPASSTAAIEASGISGQVVLSGLHGNHSLKDIESLTASDNTGNITVDGAARVKLDRIRGKAMLTRTTRAVDLSGITQGFTLDIAGGSATAEKIGGPVVIRGRNARIELRDVAALEELNPMQIQFQHLTDSRITLVRLSGNVSVDAQRTRIDASDISGDVRIKSSAERVKFGGVRGSLQAVVEDGSIEAANLEGPAELEAGREISARNFQGTMVAITRLGTITLALDGHVMADIRAESEHGAVNLSLPEDSSFRLDAATSFGRLKLRGFAYLDLPRKQRTTSVSYGRDPEAPLVTLRSTNGDISIAPAGPSGARERRASN
jgi:uncharacterized membrane protein HdeD (DUF308 family)